MYFLGGFRDNAQEVVYPRILNYTPTILLRVLSQ